MGGKVEIRSPTVVQADRKLQLKLNVLKRKQSVQRNVLKSQLTGRRLMQSGRLSCKLSASMTLKKLLSVRLSIARCTRQACCAVRNDIINPGYS